MSTVNSFYTDTYYNGKIHYDNIGSFDDYS